MLNPIVFILDRLPAGSRRLENRVNTVRRFWPRGLDRTPPPGHTARKAASSQRCRLVYGRFLILEAAHYDCFTGDRSKHIVLRQANGHLTLEPGLEGMEGAYN